ncbi:uncharacterized protein [Cardiocondyla obscurior]|uniref:uncharacterized protein n=1 Tax=Cardiocondyla obscurior TaxID=286306 RepID=UPI0039656139
MDRKGSRNQAARASRQKKRNFRGNQHTSEQDSTFASTSAEKLSTSRNIDFPVSKECGYSIINFFSVFATITSLVICKDCKKKIEFSPTSHRGLGFKICVSCSCKETYIDSSPLIDKAFEINRRIVLVFRLLDVGLEGLNLFCGLMDICQGMATNTYYACLENIYVASSAIYNCILQQAVEEEKEKNENAGNIATHLTVSGDGTWKKRGFSSLFGVSTLIGKYSNKVIDAVNKSSFCQACNLWNNKKNENIEDYEDWYATHKESCSINHIGSAGKMEVDAITEMFAISKQKYGVMYTNYIGDGDSKIFRGILNMNPYENEVTITKKECVGHVQKRMGTRLRNAKKNHKGLGGKGVGKLTDKIISELSTYYGLAIRRHPNSIEEMKKEIWATYYHKSSTDEKSQHQNCPTGTDSWCKWRKTEAASTLENFHHDNPPLGDNVLEIIKPIYEELSSDELLERCLGAETQNNESLNFLIWTFAPKHLYSGPKIIEISTFLAVTIFNEGFMPILKILNVMGIKVGHHAETYATLRNRHRITRAEQRLAEFDKRIHRREEKLTLNSFYEQEEGYLYGPGIAD